MAGEEKVTEIKGTITLKDGSTSEFTLGPEGWQQWGGVSRERLGVTVEVLDALQKGLAEADVMYNDSDPLQNEELPLEAGTMLDYQPADPDPEDERFDGRDGETVEVLRWLMDEAEDPGTGELYEVKFTSDGWIIHARRKELQ